MNLVMPHEMPILKTAFGLPESESVDIPQKFIDRAIERYGNTVKAIDYLSDYTGMSAQFCRYILPVKHKENPHPGIKQRPNGMYQARVFHDNKEHHIGTYPSLSQAVRARSKVMRELKEAS